MRIIAGEWRGFTIKAPAGEGTRPTIDRVRESLMSSLNSALGDFEGITALDAFAGSGALGLEVLSRGAESAWFYERDKAAANALEENVKKLTKGDGRAIVRKTDVLAHPPVLRDAQFGLVLLDPPYALGPAEVFGLLDSLAKNGSLAADAVISYEHAKDVDILPAAQASEISWYVIKQKQYGKIAIDILGREEE